MHWSASLRWRVAEIRALFWDMGGVSLTNGWDRNSRRKAVEKFHLEWEEFEDRHELVLDPFERGEIGLDRYVQRTVFYKERPFTIEEFKQFMFEQSQPFPETLALLKRLADAGRYLMSALNNESLEINEYRIHKFNLRQYYDVFLSSCYVGMRKPNPMIYKLALKITQCEPAECVMIDDRNLNLECARELGMDTIQFQNPAQLQQDLARLCVKLDSK
jgi:putative hydrolase of the HAD superfamily